MVTMVKKPKNQMTSNKQRPRLLYFPLIVATIFLLFEKKGQHVDPWIYGLTYVIMFFRTW